MCLLAGLARQHASSHLPLVGSCARVVVVTRFVTFSRVLTIVSYMLIRHCLLHDILHSPDAYLGVGSGAWQQLRARSCFQ